MTNRKSWKEFQEAGLLWWINRSLHLFGWAIVFEVDSLGRVTEVYPARTSARGFHLPEEDAGFIALTNHLANIAPELQDDCKE